MTPPAQLDTCQSLDRRLSIAPMMGRTDRHYRYLMRRLTKHTLLYSEMVVAEAITRGDRHRFLAFDADEHPLALQLGGSNPRVLAEAARIAADYGYDEINLNIGCPSERVKSGSFGACLMAKPQRVADCVAAMQAAVVLPITVKCRIGIDNADSYSDLVNFITIVASAGCHSFTVHARKAWLKGLSPKENRTLPPLRYTDVHALKRDFPALEIIINGGLQNLDEVLLHLAAVDGTMLGRVAYRHPWLLADADQRVFGSTMAPSSRAQVIAELLPYMERQTAHGVPLKRIMVHLLGLFYHQPDACYWRNTLSSLSNQPLDTVINCLLQWAAQ